MHLKSKDHFHVPVNKNRFPGSEGHQISQVSSSDQVPMQQIYIYISAHFMRVFVEEQFGHHGKVTKRLKNQI